MKLKYMTTLRYLENGRTTNQSVWCWLGKKMSYEEAMAKFFDEAPTLRGVAIMLGMRRKLWIFCREPWREPSSLS